MTSEYKHQLVEFAKKHDWHWSITIGIGSCPKDDELLRRLRFIAAYFTKEFIKVKYHKLAPEQRFDFNVAFEGERKKGTRHAHVLLSVPELRKGMSREAFIALFPWLFTALWQRIRLSPPNKPLQKNRTLPPWKRHWGNIRFYRCEEALAVYTVKQVQHFDSPTSRFETVIPPKYEQLKNENMRAKKAANRRRRRAIHDYDLALAEVREQNFPNK